MPVYVCVLLPEARPGGASALCCWWPVCAPVPLGRGGGGGGMTLWCVLVLVGSGRRQLADRHSLPFPRTLSLRKAVVPVGLSPPCALPLPAGLPLPSLLPLPFPPEVVPTEPPDFPCFAAPCRVHRGGQLHSQLPSSVRVVVGGGGSVGARALRCRALSPSFPDRPLRGPRR